MKLGLIAALVGCGTLMLGCGSTDEPPLAPGIMNSFERYLPGINETVTYVLAARGRSSYKYVLRADGTSESPGSVRRRETAAYVARFGAMDYSLVKRFRSQPYATVDVAIMFSARESHRTAPASAMKRSTCPGNLRAPTVLDKVS